MEIIVVVWGRVRKKTPGTIPSLDRDDNCLEDTLVNDIKIVPY